MDRDAIVAILPSDHYYSQESVFTVALESAFAMAEVRPQAVVLLGAQPKGPEVEYRWIEMGDIVRGTVADVFHVVRFHEKPRLPMAEHLFRSGCLWNTFVMVGYVSAFLDMAAASAPALFTALRSAHTLPGSDDETRIPDWLYEHIDTTGFSRQVLTPAARQLITLRLGHAGWNDLGDPDRVMSVLLERGELPIWDTRWRAEKRAERGAPPPSISMAVA
jgi:mannose-1-phosphate guanylyltransferase